MNTKVATLEIRNNKYKILRLSCYSDKKYFVSSAQMCKGAAIV